MGVIKGEKLIQEIRISCRSIGGLSDEDDYRPGFLNPGITDILDSIILYSGGIVLCIVGFLAAFLVVPSRY